VVFPNADVKFFLTAVPEERAKRRFVEHAHDRGVSFDETLADMSERDQRDATRTDSPLAKAEDAIVLDSTGLSINEVFERMMVVIREKLENG